MGKVVLTQRDDSRYADQDGVAHHFPRRYLERISAAVGDYAVFYQPRRGSRGQCYWAIAKIESVRPDPELADHFYASLSDHAEFPTPVAPWKSDAATWESAIQRDERTVRQSLTSRIVRDAAFSRIIASAYENRCAITGIRVVDRRGRSEMEAAHIRPITDKGPDIACNGVALCRTAHWLSDHGLISISKDLRVLRSRRLPQDFDTRLELTDKPIWVPRDVHLRPHKTFLEYHRDTVFDP